MSDISSESSAFDAIQRKCTFSNQFVSIFNIKIPHSTIIFSFPAKVRKFNKAAQPPDALQGLTTAVGSLGVSLPGGNVHELLEKQADLISLLKDRNSSLCERMHYLSERINGGV